MCAHATGAENGWEHLGHGIHVCSIYKNKEDQFAPVAPFYSEGLNKGERCLYIFDENTKEEIATKILEKGIAPNTQGDAPIEIVPYQEAYTNDGPFDADKMITFLEQTVSTTLEKGYSGLRAIGEMTWALSSETPLEKLIDYEKKLNLFYPQHQVTGVCQFNAERFSHEFLIEMICMHPYIIIEGKLFENKYFYTDPQYATRSLERFKAADYEAVLSIILEDTEPLTA